jgi:hypothetical protein
MNSTLWMWWGGAVLGLVVALRTLYMLLLLPPMVAQTFRLHRKPQMPSFFLMVLRFWVWNPLRLTNDIEYLEYCRNKAGPYEHLHPEYATRRPAAADRLKAYAPRDPKEKLGRRSKITRLG